MDCSRLHGNDAVGLSQGSQQQTLINGPPLPSQTDLLQIMIRACFLLITMTVRQKSVAALWARLGVAFQWASRRVSYQCEKMLLDWGFGNLLMDERLERKKGVCQRCSKEGTVWWSSSLEIFVCEKCLYQVLGTVEVAQE